MHTKITYQFTPIPSEIVASTIPSDAFKILAYMLFRQGIHGWKMRKADLCKTLGLTLYAVKKALRWLQKNGYAAYTCAYGFTQWIFRATPTAPGIPEQVEIQPVLERKKFIEIKNNNTPPTPVREQNPVVVSFEDPEKMSSNLRPSTGITQATDNIDNSVLSYPDKLTHDQLRNAKHVIKKAPVHLRQDILTAMAYYMAAGKVKNPCAYLNSLVTSANAGVFEPISAQGAAKTNKPTVPYWTGHKPGPKIDNNDFFKDLINRFGGQGSCGYWVMIPARIIVWISVQYWNMMPM